MKEKIMCWQINAQKMKDKQRGSNNYKNQIQITQRVDMPFPSLRLVFMLTNWFTVYTFLDVQVSYLNTLYSYFLFLNCYQLTMSDFWLTNFNLNWVEYIMIILDIPFLNFVPSCDVTIQLNFLSETWFETDFWRKDQSN